MRKNKRIFSFELEVTVRCNNNCRHCFVNLPEGDQQAKKQEITFKQIRAIVDSTVRSGALWCLITGGEPLLRKDFFEIYRYLKQKGLLVSVFTNATLITAAHAELFRKYPPRDIEVTVYGVTKDTYERVTRKKGSFPAFMRGLQLLWKENIKVRLKAMIMRSNLKESSAIAKFCRLHSKDFFRFDPFLYFRHDGNSLRNEEIRSERLTPEEIVKLETEDPERSKALESSCNTMVSLWRAGNQDNRIFSCGIGAGAFFVNYKGRLRLCSSLTHPECSYVFNVRGSAKLFQETLPRVLAMRSNNEKLLNNCLHCIHVNFCGWCPAHAYLETGRLDGYVPYFCDVAKARVGAFGHRLEKISGKKR
ncbi:MAG: radical SAM protein [Candidatus Omnitrophota bacterium]